MSVDDKEIRRKKREAVLKKIRALLAMTVENGASEQEAIFAAEKAAELMKEYDLSMDHIDVKESSVKGEQVDLDIDLGTFLTMIAMAISKLCETRYWVNFGGRAASKGTPYGLAHDVEISIYLLEVCRSAMQRELKRYQPHVALARRTVRMAKERSFLSGMANRLAERIAEMAAARRTGTGTALVPLKDALIEQSLKDDKIDLEPTKLRFGDIHRKDMINGRLAGDRVALNTALAGEDGSDLLPKPDEQIEEHPVPPRRRRRRIF